MKKTLAAVVTAAALTLGVGGCSSRSDALSSARNAGWTDTRVTDSSYFLNFTCQEGEIAYEIVGKNPSGIQSKATVCCGYTTPFKGCTIRY